MEKCIIVAVDDNMGIGVNGNLPWHISEDLKFFKRTTLGCPVIMGRKTYESLPFKPLKGRKNIVLTRSAGGGASAGVCGAGLSVSCGGASDGVCGASDGVCYVGSLAEAFEAAAAPDCSAVSAPDCSGRVFVIGGASVYKEALPLVDTLFITRVHTVVDGADAFFPAVASEEWTLESRSETFRDEESGLEFEFEKYTRK